MPDNPPTLRDNHFPRRWFLKSAGVATATAALGMVPAWHLAYATALTKAMREKLTPDDIIALMKKGNERFYRGKESRTITSLSRRQAPRVSILLQSY